MIIAATSSDNTSYVADGDKGGVVRDSRKAMWTWTERLTNEEVSRVREGTEEFAQHFYSAEDWNPPPTAG